eukprot:c19550_g1_i4.p1 GENE.c19550_g1_i4~~c19550_g1_i4.p1  ORF type:complete len:294 (+),score=65.90 c19550_g1_i4:346-1227(+)
MRRCGLIGTGPPVAGFVSRWLLDCCAISTNLFYFLVLESCLCSLWLWLLLGFVCRFCHMQTAAHFAGVAHYDRDVMWCVSPRYGVWCTFRVVVVFRISIPPELLAPLVPPQFSESEKSRIYHLTRRAQEEEWSNIQTLLDIREVCSVGLEHKYSEEQIEYHYSREYDRVLRTMLHNPPNSNNTNSRISTSTAATSVVASAALSSSVDAGQEASLLGSVSSSSSLSQPQPQQDTTDQSRHQQQPSETQLQKEQGGEQAQAKMAEQKDLEDSSLSFLGLSVHGDEEEWENVVPEQ